MEEYFVITAIDYDIWYSGSHNSCYWWIKKWIKPESQDKFHIVPVSMVEKFGVVGMCDKLLEYDIMIEENS